MCMPWELRDERLAPLASHCPEDSCAALRWTRNTALKLMHPQRRFGVLAAQRGGGGEVLGAAVRSPARADAAAGADDPRSCAEGGRHITGSTAQRVPTRECLCGCG
eukprot:1160305-Pelagomonas_calceolata.AAC.4